MEVGSLVRNFDFLEINHNMLAIIRLHHFHNLLDRQVILLNLADRALLDEVGVLL